MSMRDKHWTDEELLLRLFDVEPADEHLAACPECSRRWESIRLRYQYRPCAAEVPEKKLAVQRADILARLQGGSAKFRLVAASSLAAFAMLLMATWIVFKPAATMPPAEEAIVQDAVVKDIYQMSFSDEPEAIVPVQALFEER
jgi:hypothetical protein